MDKTNAAPRRLLQSRRFRSSIISVITGKRQCGIDIYRWNAHQAPVHAMRAGAVIDSVYLPKGFGNTVVVEHDDGTCLRYTHLDRKLVKKGERVARGQ